MISMVTSSYFFCSPHILPSSSTDDDGYDVEDDGDDDGDDGDDLDGD